ncbi:aBC transporter ATP-binding protein [Clostridium sp. CAG:710]|nr:aBC transporter ATP-binding protein [Clostridium sp. CAG:710]
MPKHKGGPPIATEKAKDFKGTVKKLWRYLSKYKIALIIVILFTIASTVFSVVGPKILGNATTELFNGVISKYTGGAGINFTKIGKILLFLLALYICSAIFSYIQGIIMTNISQKLAYRLRKEVSKKINKLPMKFYDNKTHGEILSVITNDIDTLSQNLNIEATQVISSVATIIGILIMMFSIDWIMTLVALLTLPLSIVIIAFIMKKSQGYFKSQQDYLADVNGEVEEMFSNQSVIRVFNAENKMISKFEYDNNKLADVAWKSNFVSGLMHPIMNFVGNLGYVVIAILGSYFAIIGRITVGNIQSFIQYTKNFTNPIAQIAQISNMLQSMVAASERVFEFLDEEEEKEKNKKFIPTNKIEGSVEFKNVKFGYNQDKIIINDFSAKVKPGQKIAIVGPTGAGKTTIVKLLMRFYDLNSGKILVDGHNINDYRKEDIRGLFGMVLQDTWLFNGTIMENIRYGRLEATDDEVIEACKMAHVHHFIQTLPDGYNMILNEETTNISGGQKQLLTIARAILADPKILILDEATSSVDTRTEILIQKAMDKLMEGRTSFIIAHRLSTIKNADLILVMDSGDIVEQGTHEELLKKNGFYAKLYNSQFEK